MNISQKGLDLIKEFEGCYLNAYRCPSNVLTIGYGHTGDVYEGQTITQSQAEELLKNDMVKYENAVNTCSNIRFTPNQNQFDALVSFTYNCGAGNLATLCSNRNANEVAEALLLYVNGSNGYLEGLARRRKAERELFLSGSINNTSNISTHLRDWQSAYNSTYDKNILVDGVPGPQTEEALRNACIRKGDKNALVGWVQCRVGAKVDNDFGNETYNKVCDFQRANGLAVDGVPGYNTFKKLLEIFNW